MDPSTVTAEDPGYYLENCNIAEDPMEDLHSFYTPIKRALIAPDTKKELSEKEGKNESSPFLRRRGPLLGLRRNRSAAACWRYGAIRLHVH